MKITKLQLRNRIRKMIRETVGETSTDNLHLTREQNAVLHKIEKQHQILGISGEDPVVLDLGSGATVEIDADGSQFWWLNEKRHRTDGPATRYANGTQFWYLNGKLHRTNGPAVIWSDGTQNWYLNGHEVTQKEHTQRTVSERM